METDKRITWEALCKAEPKLGVLEAQVRSIKDDGGSEYFCANEEYQAIKDNLDYLVGWYSSSTDAMLHTCEAYCVATDVLYNLLPPCRHCGCLST